ncbi:hypothetical protein DL769_004184 [Monosporascus sp. CRB-8-3]|nr:hypothetical protein DL769_004184 [Monosporascus sp. CRB-8-3]
MELNIWGMRIVVFGTREAVKAVIEKQSAYTSSRPEMPASCDVASGGYRLLLMPHNDDWRRARAIVHKATMPKSADNLRPAQQFEATQVIHDILTENADSASFFHNTRRYTTSLMMTATYGKRLPNTYDQDIKQVYAVMKDLGTTALPYGFLVDTFPALAKLPMWMQTWRKEAKEIYDKQGRLWTKLYNNLLKEIERNTAPECFVKHLVDNEKDRRGIDDTQAAFVSGSIIEAGSETTAGLLNSTWLYTAAHPEVLARANEELTRVVGENRSPTFDDFDKLPYISAITKEIMRIRPVTSFLIVRRTTGDVVYKDYFIPKGTAIAFSQNAIHHDDCYEDPDEFKPERYLGSNVRIGQSLTHPDPRQRVTYAFGAGRRLCPGVHIAENSLFIVVAKVLWAFDIKPPLDDNGDEMPLDTSHEAYERSAIVVPKPFKLRFIPRSAHREKIIREEWAKAETEGYWLGDIKVNKNGMLSRS